MEPFSLEWATKCMGGRIVGQTEATITGVCVDSRQVQPGMLFFALQGEVADGHQYVASALKAGAAAVVVEHVVDTTAEKIEGAQIVVPAALRALGDLAGHYRRQFAIPIVGVTGSVGKTSTKEMIAAVLRTTYCTLASEKNYNNEIGVPLTLFNLKKTHQAAVIEMGMRGLGQIGYLAEIACPTIGVLTNIGFAHIELLGSQEGIAQAKAELFAALPADGIAILPAKETARSLVMQQIPAGCRRILFSIEDFAIEASLEGSSLEDARENARKNSDSPQAAGQEMAVQADSRSLQLRADGTVAFHVRIGPSSRTYLIALQAVGTHQVPNALAALAVATALNVPTAAAIAALEAWQGAEGRMVVRHTPEHTMVLDDCYNASPESMHSALETLGKIAPGGVAVLGDMRELGAYAEQAHLALGAAIAAAQVRLLVTVGELAALTAAAATEQDRKAGLPAIVRFADARQAAAQINTLVRPGDTVLVKGSRAMGMEIIVEALTGRQGTAPHA